MAISTELACREGDKESSRFLKKSGAKIFVTLGPRQRNQHGLD
jgi:hypothetical protein